MTERWFDAKKLVQIKGPFYELEKAEEHDLSILEKHAKEGFYIVLEKNGHKRAISEDTFEERYERVNDENH